MNINTTTMLAVLNELKKYNLVDNYSKKYDFNSIIIDDITYNSNEIAGNALFFCKGMSFKPKYLIDAVNNGAVAYISETLYADVTTIPFIKVNDVRKAMSVVAVLFYQRAFDDFNLVGITGTKGKTTTTYFLKSIIDNYTKSQSAVLSTVEVFTGSRCERARLTTPESIDLQKYFYETKQNNIKYLTMEVSSQAYKLNRVFSVHFDIGIFLNIGEDHISPIEHSDFNDYLSCKLEFLRNCDTVIVNGESDEIKRVMEAATEKSKKVITYGTSNRFDYYTDNIIRHDDGYTFDVNKGDYKKNFKITIQGRFNVENALAAIITAKELGIDDESIYNGLEATKVVGRMNIFENNGKTVIVDFAHNYVSFLRLYESIKLDYPDKNIVVLFGCVGGKSYNRRRDVAVLAGRNASYIYLTADDPQFEDVKTICDNIAMYIKPFGVSYEIIEDREVAIKTAIENADKNDIIVIAGKGEENYQKIKGKSVPYPSDITIVKECLGL